MYGYRNEETLRKVAPYRIVKAYSNFADPVTKSITFPCITLRSFVNSGIPFPRSSFDYDPPTVTSNRIVHIIETVLTKIYNFAASVSANLMFGNVIESIFDETRKTVDAELRKNCPDIFKKLTETYNDLVTGSVDSNWSKVTFACRDILQDFTDYIFKPEFTPTNEKLPEREQTKNKVRYTLQAKLNKTTTESELITSQVEYLNAYLDKLTNYIQKEIHHKGFEVTKEDANRCIIYTYLIIGDILKILRK